MEKIIKHVKELGIPLLETLGRQDKEDFEELVRSLPTPLIMAEAEKLKMSPSWMIFRKLDLREDKNFAQNFRTALSGSGANGWASLYSQGKIEVIVRMSENDFLEKPLKRWLNDDLLQSQVRYTEARKVLKVREYSFLPVGIDGGVRQSGRRSERVNSD